MPGGSASFSPSWARFRFRSRPLALRRVGPLAFENEAELSPARLQVDDHVAAVFELAEEQLVAERPLDLVLDEAGERARAEVGVVALLGEVARRLPSVSAMVTLRSASCASSSLMNLSTMLSITAGSSGANCMRASRRLRNSGLNRFL